MKSKLLVLAFVSAFLFACNQNPSENKEQQTPAEQKVVALADPIDHFEFEITKDNLDSLLSFMRDSKDHCVYTVEETATGYSSIVHILRDIVIPGSDTTRIETYRVAAVAGPCKCMPCCPPYTIITAQHDTSKK